MRALEPVTVFLPGYNISQPLPKKGINRKGKWKNGNVIFFHYRITLQGILLSRDEVFLGIDALILSTPLEIDLFYQLRILECYFGDVYDF